MMYGIAKMIETNRSKGTRLLLRRDVFFCLVLGYQLFEACTCKHCCYSSSIK